MADIPVIDGYGLDQIIDKTMIAGRDLFVYDDARYGASPVATVKRGNPIGVLYSWLGINPNYGRTGYWFMFYPSYPGGSYYYTPYEPGLLSVTAYQQQGVLTPLEIKEQQELEDKPWYENLFEAGSGAAGSLTTKLLTAGVIVAVAYIAIKQFSQPGVLNSGYKK